MEPKLVLLPLALALGLVWCLGGGPIPATATLAPRAVDGAAESLLSGVRGADPTICAPLPPPTGNVVHVYPSQASQLDAVVAAATTGDTILLHDGTYDLHGDYLWFDTPGVTMRSASGNREAVVIDGHYETSEIVNVHASDVTIADLTLKRARDHPIHVVPPDDADIANTLIYNVHIVDPGQQAIKINQNGAMTHFPDDGRVACSHIELTDAGRQFVWQHNASCYTGGVDGHRAWGWVIHDNLIEGFWCEEDLAEHAIHFWTGSRDTLVERNVLRDNARGVGFGLMSSGDGRVYDDGPCPGASYVGHYDGIVRNNFVFAGRDGLFSSEYGFDCGICLAQACGAQVVHNTVASTQLPFSSIEWRFAATDAQITNNLVTHNLRQRDGASATLEGNLADAPLSLFVDGAGGDLHLARSASSAIDRGVAVAAGLCDDDIDGHPRPSGGGRDIGADEVYSVDLSSSRKTADAQRAGAGETLTYTVALRNTGVSSATDTVLFDAIPAHTTYVPGSVDATSGVATDAGAIGWTGTVSPREPVTVTFRVTVDEDVPIENTALVTDSYGTRTVLKAWVNARQVYLPAVLRISQISESANRQIGKSAGR
jgi:uncharacterized repeat protein (TIGR01451 family)